jgi:biopolymer transport protein ExbD
MGKFNKSGEGRSMPVLNTATLPDMVFAILFFFMVTTTMRTETVMVRTILPIASEAQKLERRSLVTTINIGPPTNPALGTGTQMQLNDRFAEVADIQDFITQERASMSEADQPLMTVSLKVDETTRMSYVDEVRQALRRAYALRVSYSARLN